MSPPKLFQHLFVSPEQVGEEVLGIEPDVKQLRLDAIEVLEGRLEISTFDEEYQQKIKDYYRFSATRYGSRYGKVAKRTINTLDII